MPLCANKQKNSSHSPNFAQTFGRLWSNHWSAERLIWGSMRGYGSKVLERRLPQLIRRLKFKKNILTNILDLTIVWYIWSFIAFTDIFKYFSHFVSLFDDIIDLLYWIPVALTLNYISDTQKHTKNDSMIITIDINYY